MSDEFGKSQGKRLEILKEAEEDIKEARKRLNAPHVADPAKPTGLWKVIVYMAAYGGLRSFAERDLFELCMVNTSPTSAKLQIAAQVHWEEGRAPEAYTPTSAIPIAKGQGNNIRFKQNPATASSMAQDFEKFIKQESLPQGSDPPGDPRRCMVVLWGHAAEQQFGGFGTNGMNLGEIATALGSARATQRRLDILGFDACDMSRVETIQTLSLQAKRLVCSQIGVPFSGWPYNTILDRVEANPGMNEDEVSRVILDEYYESYRPPRVTLTTLDGEQQLRFEELQKDVSVLGTKITQALSPAIAKVVEDTFVQARRDVADPLLDLRDFCVALKKNLNKPGAVPAATLQLIEPAIDALIATHDAIVKRHERRGPMVSGLHGIGISAYTITRGWDQFLEIYDRVGWRRPS